MKTPLLIIAGTLFAATAAFAQGAGSPSGTGATGATPGAAGAPSGGPGGQGVVRPGAPGGPANRGMTADPTNTPGWSMMSAEERSAHMQRMQSFKTYDECRGYMTQQTQRMNQRGAGPSGGASAGGDPCGHLPRS